MDEEAYPVQAVSTPNVGNPTDRPAVVIEMLTAADSVCLSSAPLKTCISQIKSDKKSRPDGRQSLSRLLLCRKAVQAASRFFYQNSHFRPAEML